MIDLEIRSDLTNVTNWFDEMLGDSDKLIDDILRTASNYQVVATKRRFVDQMGPDGEQWPPLRPLTLAARKRGKKSGGGGRGSKRLMDSGALRQSIVPERTRQNEMKITTNKPYARYQHDGFRSRITGKQAWWMVINLYGFNPKKPEKFAEEKGFGVELKRHQRDMAGYGELMAQNLWESLVGRWLVIPPAPFMGFNKENVEEIEKITVRHVELFLTRRGRDPSGPYI